MSDKQVEFIPFIAINEFMRPDYRATVIRTTLEALPKLPNQFRSPIDKLTKRHVRVPGFRDSAHAPAQFKVGPMAGGFAKSSELVAALLSAWAEIHIELRTKVYDLLKGRGWEILPAEADRTKLPGFLTYWPNKEDDFDVLNQAYNEAYPGEEISSDDVSLMIVWISGRLPFKVDEDETEAEQDNTSTSPSSS